MNKYKIEYICSDGYEDEEIVVAANRIMAMDVFIEMHEGNDIISLECHRILDENEGEDN